MINIYALVFIAAVIALSTLCSIRSELGKIGKSLEKLAADKSNPEPTEMKGVRVEVEFFFDPSAGDIACGDAVSLGRELPDGKSTVKKACRSDDFIVGFAMDPAVCETDTVRVSILSTPRKPTAL